jgi:hypothetical protein
MTSDSGQLPPEQDEVPLLPAGAIGYLLFPWAIELIRANPPANDTAAIAGRG